MSLKNNRDKRDLNPYLRQLQEIAKITEYESIASIPQQSKDFIYTINKSNQQMFGNRRVIRKDKHQKINDSFGKISEKDKLMTILQDNHKHNIFLPKIQNSVKQQQKSGKSKLILRRVSSIEKKARQNNKTIDTRMQTEQQKSLSLGQILKNSKLNIRSFQNEFSLSVGSHQSNQSPDKSSSRYKYSQPILPEEDESQDESEYQKNSVPGPGAYTYSSSEFDKIRDNATRSTNASSFMSKASRFQSVTRPNPQDSPEAIEKRRVYLINLKRRQHQLEELRKLKVKKEIPFNAESPRKFEYQLKKDQAPGPMDYSPRLGIEEDLIHKIQRNFKGNFGSYEARFFDPLRKSNQLGPGQYNYQTTPEEPSNGNYYFISKKNRFELK